MTDERTPNGPNGSDSERPMWEIPSGILDEAVMILPQGQSGMRELLQYVRDKKPIADAIQSKLLRVAGQYMQREVTIAELPAVAVRVLEYRERVAKLVDLWSRDSSPGDAAGSLGGADTPG